MFKKGDLVEVIGSDGGREDVLGLRFNLEHYEEVLSLDIFEYVYAWRTPLEDFSARECYLKKVNPDGDELSSESFDQIMESLKSKSNIIDVNLTLDK